MIKRFIEVDGRMLFPIAGQQRIAYTLSGSTDFYELKEREKHGGHPGTVIKFYDYRRRRVVQPFEQKPNVMYSAPILQRAHLQREALLLPAVRLRRTGPAPVPVHSGAAAGPL